MKINQKKFWGGGQAMMSCRGLKALDIRRQISRNQGSELSQCCDCPDKTVW